MLYGYILATSAHGSMAPFGALDTRKTGLLVTLAFINADPVNQEGLILHGWTPYSIGQG